MRFLATAAALAAMTVTTTAAETDKAETAVAALECSLLAPDGPQERRLLELGYTSALEYIAFIKGGGEPDFTQSAAGQFTNVIINSFPNDDFSVGHFYNQLGQNLEEYLEWAEVYSPEHMTHHSGKAATAEFEKRNCKLLQ